MKRIITVGILLAYILSGATAVLAQDKSRIPPMSLYQAMLDASAKSGWVQFRNFLGKQILYFTSLQTLHCRLKEIRYSVNNKELDERFPIVACNPQLPLSSAPDSKLEDILFKVPLGTAKFVAVQVVWEDGRESAVKVFEPCKDVGDQTCAWPVE